MKILKNRSLIYFLKKLLMVIALLVGGSVVWWMLKMGGSSADLILAITYSGLIGAIIGFAILSGARKSVHSNYSAADRRDLSGNLGEDTERNFKDALPIGKLFIVAGIILFLGGSLIHYLFFL